MAGRSARRDLGPSPLYKHLVKLVFFVLTFIVFVVLQNSQGFFGELLGQFHRGISEVPWWIVPLAAVGAMSILWILFLGISQFVERIRGRRRPMAYGGLISDSESDEEVGVQFVSRRTRHPVGQAHPYEQASAGGSPRRPAHSSQAHGGFGGPPGGGYHGGPPRPPRQQQQGGGSDEQDSQNPTDVDVTVHPVDTTIAAGGEARVSPTYNVSLMSFPPGAAGSNQLYPTAPTMQGGPAFFKRSFQ